MQFLNLTRRLEIGANSYALRAGKHTLLIDSGMHPKELGVGAQPDFASLAGVPPPDAILLSHAHQDHVGTLPIATRLFPETPVYMTPETARLADTMLHNSVNVMTRQREEKGFEDYPLFTHRGVELSTRQWMETPIGVPIGLDGERAENGETSFTFYDAGHILGSAGIIIQHEGRKIFYTGDVNFDSQTLLCGADFPTEDVDVLIMETTRGDSPLPPDFTRDAEALRLLDAMKAVFDRGGSVFIPVFALGKTQELLATFWKFRRDGLLSSSVPLYIGGLSTKITEAYDEFAGNSRRHFPELHLLQALAPYVLSGREAGTIEPKPRSIYALSSGMMTENTLSNVFARHILPHERHATFFVGYCDPESPAGLVQATARGESVRIDADKDPVPIRCQVDTFNFSAHASRESLVDYAVRLKPRKILLVHGDEPAITWFQKELAQRLPNTAVILPQPGQWIDL